MRSTFGKGDVRKPQLTQEVSFLNKASIKETMNNISDHSTTIIDVSSTSYIDFDVLNLIRDF